MGYKRGRRTTSVNDEQGYSCVTGVYKMYRPFLSGDDSMEETIQNKRNITESNGLYWTK